MPRPQLLRCGNWRISFDDVQAIETTSDADGLVARVYLAGVGVELRGEAAAALLRHVHEAAPGGPSITITERRETA